MPPSDGVTLEFTVFDGTTIPDDAAAPLDGTNNQEPIPLMPKSGNLVITLY